MAGIYRVTAENGRDHKYEIHVLAGAENVASELRAYLSKLPEESKPTFDQFLNSQEMSYARAISEENCKRIGYAVARALKVNISQIRSEMSFTPASTSFAKPLRAEPKINQPVSSIMRVEYPQRVAVAVFSGVTPIQRCSDRFVVAGSAYDANIGFRMPMDRDQRIDSLGLPVMMARTKPSDALSPLAPKEVAHRTQHLIWEGKLPSGMHPSAHPEAFASPIGRSFLDTMEKHGWSRKEHFDSAVPVLVKISNPMMKRGK
jgi:hypothetical protein